VSDPKHGYRHQQLRKALMINLRNSSDGVDCAHGCGVRIAPDTPSYRIDLAHLPGSDTAYAGLAHSHCNRSDGAWGERRVGRPPAWRGQSSLTRPLGQAAPPRVTPEQMTAGYELKFFGRTGVAEGETTTDAQGRTWVKVGDIVVQQWWE
jgi:hypothetical protein